MHYQVTKLAQVAALVAGVFAVNAMAADGQIRINGEVLNKSCTVTINGAPSSILLNLDAVAAADLTSNVTSANGATLNASREMPTVNITLSQCVLPPSKTGVAVSFDSTGYADAGTSTYRNSLLDSVNTMDHAAQGVQMGFTKVGKNVLLMNEVGLDTADYKDPTTQAQTYSFSPRYVQIVADKTNVKAGDIETVATFSLVYP